jgi:hypothetical protein
MSAKIMFLDESGDHNLTVIDPQYPLFVLGGVIVDRAYAEGELTDRVRQLKLKLFGRDDFLFHTSEIVRSRGIFKAMRQPAFRVRFYTELNAMMRSLDYQVIACVIKKDEHYANYGLDAVDPYMLSLNILVERFCFELEDVPTGGLIVAEKRGHVFDRELELAWINLKVQGTRFVRAVTITERINQLVLRDKQDQIAGLEIADLVVSPIGRYILGKRMYEDWEIIESKFRRYRGSYWGAGLIVLPRETK